MVGDAARIVILSTPNGKSGFYWDRLTNGNPADRDIETVCNLIKTRNLLPCQYWTDDNQWCKFVVHWLEHPIYSKIPNYLEQVRIKKQLSASSIEQEYNLNFEESEVNVFPSDLVRCGAVGSFCEPELNQQYYIGIDTSTTGEDYTVGVVVRHTQNRLDVVHIYRKRKHSMEYHIDALGALIRFYKPLKVAIEVTGGTGQVYLEQLSKRFYGSDLQAIRTSADTKIAMIDRILLCLEKRNLFYPNDSPLTEELLTFRRSGKKLSSPSGKNDDTVMALGFALSLITL